MNRILLVTKNDFEGMASAILLKYIHADNIDIQYYNYKTPSSHYESDVTKYEMVIAVGLKNAGQLTKYDIPILICSGFEDLYSKCNGMYPEDFNNHSLEIFKENVSAYIDWSWTEKRLYFGKNIDELSKYIGREEMINKVAERISLKEEIITASEKDMLVFVKKMMTNNIQNKRYEIITVDNKKFAVTYGEMYEIELSNHILAQEKDIDAVVVFNMTTRIARIKTSKGVSMEKNIAAAGGLTNSNGGTIKFGPAFDRTIFMSVLNKL